MPLCLQLTTKHCKERVVIDLYLCLNAGATAGTLAYHDSGSKVDVRKQLNSKLYPVRTCTGRSEGQPDRTADRGF